MLILLMLLIKTAVAMQAVMAASPIKINSIKWNSLEEVPKGSMPMIMMKQNWMNKEAPVKAMIKLQFTFPMTIQGVALGFVQINIARESSNALPRPVFSQLTVSK